MKKSILLIFLLIILSTLSACSAAIKTAEVLLQDELESEEEEEEISIDPKELASKAPSAEFSAEDLFSTTLFKEDPAMLQFSKKIEKHISTFDSNFTVIYRGKLD